MKNIFRKTVALFLVILNVITIFSICGLNDYRSDIGLSELSENGFLLNASAATENKDSKIKLSQMEYLSKDEAENLIFILTGVKINFTSEYKFENIITLLTGGYASDRKSLITVSQIFACLIGNAPSNWTKSLNKWKGFYSALCPDNLGDVAGDVIEDEALGAAAPLIGEYKDLAYLPAFFGATGTIESRGMYQSYISSLSALDTKTEEFALQFVKDIQQYNKTTWKMAKLSHYLVKYAIQEENSAAKKVDVECPVDVFVYNNDDVCVAKVINDEIVFNSGDVYLEVHDSKKTIVFDSESYSLNIVATDNGKMTYRITEYLGLNEKREIEYADITLEDGFEFTADVNNKIYTKVDDYNLHRNSVEIECTFDSLPSIENDIADVVVAEDLFAGFSVELIDKVANAMFKFEPVVDILSYNISTDDTAALFSAISKYYPTEYSLLAKTDFKYKIIFSPSLGCITDIRFYYGEDANLEAFEQRAKDLKGEIDKIVVPLNGMSEFEKALYIHDYIVLNSEYDLEILDILETEGTLSGELRSERYTEYSILINGTGICGSYALAYRALMNAAGVDCIYLSSQQMNHAWNMVKIDGEWYHVDCCWDDPVPDYFGMARRTYFLRTDEEMMKLYHFSWSPDKYKAESNIFSKMPRDNDINQKFDSGLWYLNCYSSIVITDQYGKVIDIINRAPSVSVSVDAENELVYFLQNNIIYEYDKNTKKTQIAFVPDDGVEIINFYVLEKNIFYYGLKYSNGGMIYCRDTVENQKHFYDSIEGLKLNVEQLELSIFDEYTLIPLVYSTLETDKLLLDWTSSNEDVIGVTDDGIVCAKMPGESTVTLSVGDFSVSCEIVVSDKYIGGFCGDNVKWKLNTADGTLSIFGSGAMDDSSIGSLPWEGYEDAVKHVVIGKDVSFVEMYWFTSYYCQNIEFFCVEEGNAGYCSDTSGVLYDASMGTLLKYPKKSLLDEYEIPAGVKTIGKNAFMNAHNLVDVTIPEGVETLESGAFNGCENLTQLILPDSLKSIFVGVEFYSLGKCSALEKIIVGKNNQYFSNDENGVLFNKDKTKIILYPSNCSLNYYQIPESVKTIGQNAFSECRYLQSIHISNNVTTIEARAFEKCNGLKSLEIPDSVQTAEAFAIVDCANIEKVVIGKNLNSTSFLGHSLKKLSSIIVDEQNPYLTVDKSGALYTKDKTTLILLPTNSGVEHFTIPETVTTVSSNAFWGNDNLKSLYVKANIGNWGSRLTACNNLETIILGEGVTQIYRPDISKNSSLKNVVVLNANLKMVSLIQNECVWDENCIVYGYSGSTIENYANKNGISFVDIEQEHTHKYFLVEVMSETESEDAHKNYVCYCGEEKHDVIHTYETTSVSSNMCTNGVLVKKTCKKCGQTEETNEVMQHNFKYDSTVQGTCVEPGKKIYKCTVCSHTEEKELVSDDCHSYIETVTAPTCTEIGYTTATCEYCGENAMYDFVPMLGHDVTVIHTDADCKKYAQTEYSCSRCDYHEIIVDEDGGLGEHKISVSVTESTCTVNGSIDQICVTCNELISSEVITANGHVSGEWKTVTEPTTETAGRKEQRCEICSELLDEEAIPKIPVNVSGVELSESKIEIIKKSTHSLNAIILPDNADNKYVVWSSDNENVATVDENGVVTANALGNANITATTTDGGFTATCAVIVIPREFNVTWIVDGEKNVESFKEESTIIEPETPEKEGYSFVGWTPDIPDVMPDYDIEFTAIWLPNSYDAVFNANGGKWADGAEEKTVSTEFDSHIVVPESPEKQGYIFSGWTPEVGVMDDANGKKFSAVWIASTDTIYTVETYTMNTLGEYEKDIKTINGATDSTVNAKYEITEGFALNEEKSVLSGIVSADNSLVLKVYIDRNVYIFTTVVDGVSTATEYYYESVIADPETPVKTGYTFVGWDNNVPASMPANNVTITADFDANSYDAIFNANGGQWGDGSSSKTASTVFDSTIIVPEEPTRKGYDFVGWDSEIGIMDDINGKEFNAKWVARNDTSYTVEIYTMDVDGEYSVEKETKQGETDSKVSVTANTQSGFTFNSTNSILEGNIAADGSLVLKVFYDRNKYTLKYVVDGVETLVEYYYNASVETPAVPSKTGYTFAGWDKEIPATMPAHNLLVSAKFVCSASVSIKNNPDTKTIKYGETLRLTATTTNMPADAKIYWYVDGAKKGEGETFDVTFENGTKTVEVKLVDASDNVLKNASGNEISDSESVTVKGGFFQKIISFFKDLFGINRTIIQTVFRKR